MLIHFARNQSIGGNRALLSVQKIHVINLSLCQDEVIYVLAVVGLTSLSFSLRLFPNYHSCLSDERAPLICDVHTK